MGLLALYLLPGRSTVPGELLLTTEIPWGSSGTMEKTMKLRNVSARTDRAAVSPLVESDLLKVQGGQRLIAHELAHVIQQGA